MAGGKKHTAEQIVNLLRQVEVGVANGKTLPQACKEAEIVEQTYYRWRKEYGGLKVDQARRLKESGTGERQAEATGLGVEPGEAGVEGHRLGKLLSPERRRCAVDHAQEQGLSERRACRLVKQPRGTQRYQLTQRETRIDSRAIVELASSMDATATADPALLKRDGWQVGKDRVERIWRREGLKVPQKQKPRRRLWLNDGSCVRLRPQHANHVWSYDFVSAKTYDGRTVRMLNLIDEHSRECLMIRAGTKVEFGQGDRSAGRRDGVEGSARASSLRQWP